MADTNKPFSDTLSIRAMLSHPYRLSIVCIVLYLGLVSVAYPEVSASKGCRFYFANMAIEACSQAIETLGDIGSYQRLAELLDKGNRTPEAIKVYQEGLQKYPNDRLMKQRYELLLSNQREQEKSVTQKIKKSDKAKSLKYSCLHLPRNMKLTLNKCKEALRLQNKDTEIITVIKQIQINLSNKKKVSRENTSTKIVTHEETTRTERKSSLDIKGNSSKQGFSKNLKTTGSRKRYALVIGNSKYLSVAPIKNAVNDAADIAKKLKTLGFEVTLKKNANRKKMLNAIRKFGDTLYKNPDSVGIFYYAGHGVQVDGKNYFIPINSNVQARPDIEYENVGMDRIVDYLAYAGNELNFFIIDACRDNPYRNLPKLTRSIGNTRGLASNTNVPTGLMYFYAAKPGQKAVDGLRRDRNSPFTSALLKYLGSSDLSIEQIFKQVTIEVYNKTNKVQHPWSEGIITSEFYPGR